MIFASFEKTDYYLNERYSDVVFDMGVALFDISHDKIAQLATELDPRGTAADDYTVKETLFFFRRNSCATEKCIRAKKALADQEFSSQTHPNKIGLLGCSCSTTPSHANCGTYHTAADNKTEW